MEILGRANQANVKVCLSISTSVSNAAEVVDLVQAHSQTRTPPFLFCAVGIHPCDVSTSLLPQETQAWLEEMSCHPKVVALGETGLDGQPTSPPLALQEAFFRAHIAASQSTGLPLVVHTRQNDADFLRILKSIPDPKPRGVLHCFTGSIDCAQQAVDWGWKVSFSGILTFPNAPEVRAVARALPIDSLLIETDAPWLAPANWRGKRNEPAYITQTLQTLCQLHGLSSQQMAQRTSRNFFDLFQKASLD
jgi:TatD DNase family protein